MPSEKLGAMGITSDLPVQERVLGYLRGGRCHPAVILGGPARTEKLQLAKNIAKYFLCTTTKRTTAYCDTCSACRRVDREVHPDLLLYRDSSEEIIKIDSIREICSQMELTPAEGRAKICIIDDCHRMNSAAANAFLKTLEEPGPDRYFWLLTNNLGALLPTLLSRCLKFSLRPNEAEASETPEEIANFEKIYGEFHRSGNTQDLIDALDSKEQTVKFVRFLETRFRHDAIHGSVESLQNFQKALQLEGRLRSNANYALMLESFLLRVQEA